MNTKPLKTAPGLSFLFPYRYGGQANFWGGRNFGTFLCRILQIVMKIILQKFETVVEVGLIVLKAEQNQIDREVTRPIPVSCLEASRFEFCNTVWPHWL